MHDFTPVLQIFVITLRLLASALALTMSVASIVESRWLLGVFVISLLVAIIGAKMTAFGGTF